MVEKACEVHRDTICHHTDWKKLKCLQLVDHNVAVNRNCDCKANDAANQDDSDDCFEDFLEDFQVLRCSRYK